MSTDNKVSIVIPTYDMGNVIKETIYSCLNQAYINKEIIVYDDCSTDGTELSVGAMELRNNNLHYHRGKENVGVGNAINAAISLATGDIIVLMCADDLFTSNRVIPDIVDAFESNKLIGHVTRYYHQFVHGNRKPVRAWRNSCPIMLASNPSGLAFRKEALEGNKASQKMFVETSALVSDILADGWDYKILPYDAIAVRVHESTSTKGGYWLKHRVSSPVQDWYDLGCDDILTDYSSLVQIKCNFKTSALMEEIWNFIKLRPANLYHPKFWFYSMLTLLTPRTILRPLPHIYRKYLGALLTKEKKRCSK